MDRSYQYILGYFPIFSILTVFTGDSTTGNQEAMPLNRPTSRPVSLPASEPVPLMRTTFDTVGYRQKLANYGTVLLICLAIAWFNTISQVGAVCAEDPSVRIIDHQVDSDIVFDVAPGGALDATMTMDV